MPIPEGMHLNGLAVAESEDIGDAHLLPLLAVFRSHPHMNEHDDLIAGDYEAFRLAADFRPSFARLSR